MKKQFSVKTNSQTSIFSIHKWQMCMNLCIKFQSRLTSNKAKREGFDLDRKLGQTRKFDSNHHKKSDNYIEKKVG